MIKSKLAFFLLGLALALGCGSILKEKKDEIYSRHLQKHISLTILSTPAPADKSEFNLLLLNNGKTMNLLTVRNIIDSLAGKKLIKPLIVVNIDAFDPEREFGIAGFQGTQKGDLAEKYSDFIVNELLPFVKKKAGTRKFNSVSFAGKGMAGISALDITWDNWQKFDKAGYFPDFSLQDSSAALSLLIKKISQSAKKPKAKFWLYYEGNDLHNKSEKIDSINLQQLINAFKKKGILQNISLAGFEDQSNGVLSFNDSFSKFLLWLNEAD
jgi:hypothetical protein